MMFTVSYFLFCSQQEELNKQMQEQVSLLQELEEQRVKLEQMLLEAQQERELLKAAVQVREHQAQRCHLQAPLQELPAITPGLATEVSCLSLSLLPSVCLKCENLRSVSHIIDNVYLCSYPPDCCHPLWVTMTKSDDYKNTNSDCLNKTGF